MSEKKAVPSGPSGQEKDDPDSLAPSGQAAVPETVAPRPIRVLARHALWVLALVAVVLWLPGIARLPAIDRDESRFAQSSRQMLESGDIVDIRFGQVPRYKKPVGIYWLQAAATKIAGLGDRTHIWTYRVPSLFGGIIAVWLTFWSGSLFNAETGVLAGRLLLTTLLLTVEASMATTDAVLLAAIMAMQGVLLRVWRAAKENTPPPSTRLILLGWAALAIAVLVKGPVGPAVALATIAALFIWDRQWKEGQWRWLAGLKPLPGIALALVISTPWAIAIAISSRGAFFQQSLGNDFAAKLAEGQEGHGALPGYYLLLSALTLWPAILFVVPALGLALTRRSEPLIRFLIAWAASWWVVVEIVPTKLPNYVLPALPPLMILAALWLLTPHQKESGWRRFLPWIAALQFVVGLVALGSALILLPQYYATNAVPLADSWPLQAIMGAAGLAALATLILFLIGWRISALVASFVTAAILVLTLTAWTLPGLDRIWVSERLAALLAKDRRPSDPPAMLAGYQEPSLVFALGADTILADGRGAADQGAKTGGLALVDDQERPSFLARLAELEANANAVDDLTGFNYSRGKSVHVTLYRVAPLNPVPTPGVP